MPVSEVPGRQHLCSAIRRKLNIPRFCRSTFGTRAFSVAGRTVWNSLPDYGVSLLTAATDTSCQWKLEH